MVESRVSLFDKASAAMGAKRERSAQKYAFCKYGLWFVDTFYVLFLLLAFLGLGFSKLLAQKVSGLVPSEILVLPGYLLLLLLVYYLFDFPLNYYRSFVVEHKFCLSQQKLGDWFLDQIKAGLLSYILGLILVSAFYYILRHYQDIWWLVISFFWVVFSLVLARLVPVFIIPLFFKYKKLGDDNLRQRILGLADKMKIKILDCFEIDFSKKTLKANAAFVGWGATKRVILADTLKDKYSYDEVEVILAHEFAHYKLKHLLKLLLVNSSAILACFYFIFKTSDYALKLFGLSSLQDLAALPLVLIYLLLFGIVMQPFENYVSRRLERNADRMALEVTGLKDAFISMMEKLATQNLADRKPNLFIKSFFFDHPPMEERIAMARNLK
ncbi:MAG: M48 family metalloprotease [Candidatus Omnitrophota bacterium]